MKKVLTSNLELFRIDPDAPFILRTDASDRAIGAVLEQERMIQGELQKVPVGFFSRKLAKSQLNWTPREKETYAVVSALRKWAGWIGLQPVLITTDHKSLEDWVLEKMDTPSGPAGRRARWHETLSKFDLEIKYIPGPDNVVADALSRFAYPASKAFQDTSFHGSEESRIEMKNIIEEELAESKTVGLICFDHTRPHANQLYIAGTMSRAKFARLDPQGVHVIEARPTQASKLNINATPFVPNFACEARNEVPVENQLPHIFENLQQILDSDEFSGENFDVAPMRYTPKRKKKVQFQEPPIESSSSSSQPAQITSRTTIHPAKSLLAWDKDYKESEWWSESWEQINSDQGDWPEGMRINGGKLIHNGLICVPESKTLEILRDLHQQLNHAGIAKTLKEATRRYAFSPKFNLGEEVRQIRRGCLICQACDPPNWSGDTPLDFTPIPSIYSVAFP